MTSTRGVVYVAIGDAAEVAACSSVASLRNFYDGPIEVWTNDQLVVRGAKNRYVSRWPYSGGVQVSRYLKVSMLDISPFRNTLYLDADTLVRGQIDTGFDILDDGYDLVVCASANQGGEAMHHIEEEERWYTMCQLYGCTLQLQAGVVFVRKSDRTRELFWAWRYEWQRWHKQDQAALMRALDQNPVKLWLLGRPWNGGAIIEHRFGRARDGR